MTASVYFVLARITPTYITSFTLFIILHAKQKVNEFYALIKEKPFTFANDSYIKRAV